MSRLLQIAAFLAAACTVGAVQVTLDVQPRVLTLGESATLTLSIEGAGQAAAPNLPNLDGFQIGGHSQSSSMSLDNSGQHVTVSHQFMLNPLRTGNFQIGPFSYDINGQSIDLPAITVQVLPPGSAAPGKSADSSDTLFATLTTDPTNLYHQQTFDLVMTIYSSGLNLDRQVGANFNTTGLKVDQLQEVQQGREVVKGRIYDVRRWKGKATALTAGNFHLTPTIQVGLISERQRRGGDPFGDGLFADFFGRREVRAVEVPIQPLDLVVKPLPDQGRPPSFSGAVGHFTFDVSLSPSEVAAGEPVTVQTQLSGDGNIALISPPSLAVGDGFRSYDAKLVTDEVDASRGRGRKVFEQVLIPRSSSVTGLPELAFSFFNPESGAYETIRRGPLPLLVHDSSNEASRVVAAAAPDDTPAQRVLLGADIGYLKPAPAHWSRTWNPAWLTSPLLMGAQAIPPLFLAAVFLIARRRDSLRRDVRKARRQQAPRSARAALAEAESALARNDAAACHDAVWRALSLYFANRLNLQPGEATPDVVAARLQSSKAPEALQQEISAAFSRCEVARYGLGTSAADAGTLRPWIDEVTRMLRDCEGLTL